MFKKVFLLFAVLTLSLFTQLAKAEDSSEAASFSSLPSLPLSEAAGIVTDDEAFAAYLALVEPAVYPITLTDAVGTELTLEKSPTAIISTSLGIDELLLGIVSDERILAISGAIAENGDISNIAETAMNYDKAESNSEYILSLQPDLIIAPSWTPPEVVQQYRDADINVYCVGAMLSIDELKTSITELGKLLGEPAGSAAMLYDINAVLAYVDETLADMPEDGRLRVLTYNSYGSTHGTGSSCDDIIAYAHLRNAANEVFEEPYPQISTEMVIGLDPDIILLPSVSYTDVTAEEFVQAFINDPAYSSLKAVKNNAVLVMPDKHFSAVSQYMALAVIDLAQAAYPSYFGK